MKTGAAIILGMLVGGVTTTTYLYSQIYIPWVKSDIRSEEAELKLLSLHIENLKQGRYQEVTSALEAELTAKQTTINLLKNAQ
ncbi:hypothetical protein ACJJIW_00195 [Microbulbifer sp. JMSA004]|uniref:hypothetical protein n=1 Tax=unclassified Microbulbifer TaxID=2619833 RepID=UPI00403A942E